MYLLDGEVISGPDAETLMDTTQTRNLLIDELLEVQAGFISIVLNYFLGLLLSIKGLWRGTHLTLFTSEKCYPLNCCEVRVGHLQRVRYTSHSLPSIGFARIILFFVHALRTADTLLQLT